MIISISVLTNMQTLKETLTFFLAAKITLNIDYHTVYTQQALILLTLFKTNKTKKCQFKITYNLNLP